MRKATSEEIAACLQLTSGFGVLFKALSVVTPLLMLEGI